MVPVTLLTLQKLGLMFSWQLRDAPEMPEWKQRSTSPSITSAWELPSEIVFIRIHQLVEKETFCGSILILN